MLMIKTEQISALNRDAYVRFEQRLVDYLFEHLPHSGLSEDESALRDTVKTSIQSAARYGYSTEPDVTRYVYLEMLLGSDLLSNPQFTRLAALLLDSAQEPGARLDTAFEALARAIEDGRLTLEE